MGMKSKTAHTSTLQSAVESSLYLSPDAERWDHLRRVRDRVGRGPALRVEEQGAAREFSHFIPAEMQEDHAEVLLHQGQD